MQAEASAKSFETKDFDVKLWGLGSKVDSPPEVDRIWGIWGSYDRVPKAIFIMFYLLKGTIGFRAFRLSVKDPGVG